MLIHSDIMNILEIFDEYEALIHSDYCGLECRCTSVREATEPLRQKLKDLDFEDEYPQASYPVLVRRHRTKGHLFLLFPAEAAETHNAAMCTYWDKVNGHCAAYPGECMADSGRVEEDVASAFLKEYTDRWGDPGYKIVKSVTRRIHEARAEAAKRGKPYWFKEDQD